MVSLNNSSLLPISHTNISLYHSKTVSVTSCSISSIDMPISWAIPTDIWPYQQIPCTNIPAQPVLGGTFSLMPQAILKVVKDAFKPSLDLSGYRTLGLESMCQTLGLIKKSR